VQQADLGNNASAFWELGESLRRKEKAPKDQVRVHARVAGNILSNEFQVRGGAGGPKKPRHMPRRRFRSS
jgi:hypothetical protein